MQWSMRPRAVLAALAAILAGLTFAASAISVDDSGSLRTMPGSSCPPSC